MAHVDPVWVVVDPPRVEEPQWRPTRLPQIQCPCGWFAKYVRTYVSSRGETRIVVRCKRCGETEIY